MYLKRSSKVNVTGERWINKLAGFNFMVHYKPRDEKRVAETLSRFPLISEEDKVSEKVSADGVKVRSNGVEN